MWSKGLSSLADPAGCELAASIFVSHHILSKFASVFYKSSSFCKENPPPYLSQSLFYFGKQHAGYKTFEKPGCRPMTHSKMFHVTVIDLNWTSIPQSAARCTTRVPNVQRQNYNSVDALQWVSQSSESHSPPRPPWTTSVVELSPSYPHLLQCASACPGHPLCVCTGLSGWGLNPRRWGSPFNTPSTIAQLITLLFQVRTLSAAFWFSWTTDLTYCRRCVLWWDA